MPSRKNVVLVVVFLVVLVAGAGFFLTEKEPSYEGRSFSEWLHQWYQTDRFREADTGNAQETEAEKAIRSIGVKALPIALERIRYQPPAGAMGQLDRMLFSHKRIIERENVANEAVGFFIVLKGRAKDAIPDLVKLLDDTPSWAVRLRATTALLAMGDDALPHVMEILGDPTHPASGVVAERLSDLKLTESKMAVFLPQLVKLSMHTDQRLAISAVLYLYRLNNPELPRTVWTNAAKSSVGNIRLMAVPNLGRAGDIGALEQMLSDPDTNVQRSASNELHYLKTRVPR